MAKNIQMPISATDNVSWPHTVFHAPILVQAIAQHMTAIYVARKKVEDCQTERPYIHLVADADPIALCEEQLRWTLRSCADVSGMRTTIQLASQPKVCKSPPSGRMPFWVFAATKAQDVGWLYVAMEYASAVGMGQAMGDLRGCYRRLLL